ncbi:SagB family peptide dehydrogenase [Saccharopolyspora taberi]|uniref:Nitroreductase domain-containing protein n=1 Tax=Saccharopolyspora taberi TaxID=60895 RepID=A0ABN3VH67_9PSEU
MATRYRRNPELMLEWGEDHDSVVVVDPRTLRRFNVKRTLLDVLNRMSAPVLPGELAVEGEAEALLMRLAEVGIVEPVDGARAPDGKPEWTPPELAVHALAAQGGVSHLRPDEVDIPPARLRHPDAVETIPLPAEEACPSKPLRDVLRSRRSMRDFAATPVDFVQLARFLGESARVRGWLGPRSWQATRRPSASGGGRHSLEIYVFARDVSGLASGAYHYDPFDHALERLRPWGEDLADLQHRLICLPTLTEHPPPVSLYLVAHYRRVRWKYGGMTLSLIYRDTGCLLQTMYLVATDLGLAPCATAAVEAQAGPDFLRPYRDQVVHVANFALGNPARTEPTSPAFHPLTGGDQ